MKINSTLIAIVAIVVVLGAGYVLTRPGPATPTGAAITPTDNTGDWANFQTFETKEGAEVCMENGKPLILLFSTTSCPHCVWIKDTFDSVAQEYVDAGKIAAYHWELNRGSQDNTLTEEIEGEVPISYMNTYNEFGGGYVPTFVLGCKYYRVGNNPTYESQNDLNSAAQELRDIIDYLISQTS